MPDVINCSVCGKRTRVNANNSTQTCSSKCKNAKIKVVKQAVLQMMKDITRATDVSEGYVWWMPGPIAETAFERLITLYLMAGGTEKELAEIWPANFDV